MILSILIPTTADREWYFAKLMKQLDYQINHYFQGCWNDISKDAPIFKDINENMWQHIEILKDTRPQPVTIGEKRNFLLQSATGKYVCFIDSDDMISDDFIKSVLFAIQSEPDCLSMRGIMTTDFQNPEIFEHSLKYNQWKTNEGALTGQVKYERYPNHLNVIRADIAKQFKFPETNHGEDYAWSKSIHESGLLKNEVYTDKVLYYYQYRKKK
jgi:glycosyltransferase involved in cell wall biosynthesis